MAIGTAETALAGGDGDDSRYIEEGLEAAHEHATQPAVDEEFERIVSVEGSNVIDVGMMFPSSRRFAEVLPLVRRARAFKSGHLILAHINPQIHRG